ADRQLLGRKRVPQRHVMDSAVNAVDDHPDAVAQLINEPLVDHAPDDRHPGLLAMEIEALDDALLAPGGERSVDRLDDVAALAELPQHWLEAVAHGPYSRFTLLGEPVAFQLPQTGNAERAVER